MFKQIRISHFLFAIFVIFVLIAGGCQSTPSPSTTQPPTTVAPTTAVPVTPGPITGTITGTVTNSLTNAPVAGVTVATDPVIQGVTITSAANGSFSATLPVGSYALSFKKTNFKPLTQPVSIVSGQTTKNIALAPAAPVVVSLGTPLTAAPGASLSLKAAIDSLDGSTVVSYSWAQTGGTKAILSDNTTDTVKIALANAAAYKAQLISSLAQEDRYQVQPINPHAVSATEVVSLRLTVTTSSGKYSAVQTVTSDLPYAVTTGIEDVPVAVPVLLHAKKQNSYRWTLAGPSGSKAVIDGASEQNPAFTPDVPGKYTLTEATGNGTVTLYAGTWEGAITSQDAAGKPISAGCVVCHNDKIAPDQFKDWSKTGHAAIFTKNINTSTHYSEDCLACHSVGYDKKANNLGIDEQPDYAAFVASGMLSKASPNNWSNMFAKFPRTAQLANIQCENCHGPNKDTGLHGNGKIDASRVSISADVCGSCHGEPLRHGRFQQWEESGHSNFELAIDDATVEARGATAGHCGRCHTGQGFLAWTAQGDLTKQIQGKNGNATVDELKAMGLTKDSVQPQTCAVCHDPHAEGASSGEPNTATVRIMNNTPMLPSGFDAKNVGKGAICITCHNTRNGLHNDDAPPANYTAPHTPSQADILMGQNAYLVPVGQRSPHSFLTDTCVTCHMEATPPPAEFSFEGGGTNHAFNATGEICATCHSNTFEGDAFKSGTLDRIKVLGAKMGTYMVSKMPASATLLDYTPHTANGKNYDMKSDKIILDKTNIASMEPVEPHGQEGFLVKLKNAISVTYSPANEASHTVSVKELQVQLGDVTTDGKTPVIASSDTLVKAAWNYFLVSGDGSGGIHNPAYVNSIISASITALK